MAHRWALGRRAGLLLPLSSVRGESGDIGSYGDFGAIARWLASGGCTLWQLLPMSEVSPGQDSPYGAVSSFALEPVYIDLAQVPEHVELGSAFTPAERATLERARAAKAVDFEAFRSVKRAALRRAYAHFKRTALARRSELARELARFRAEQASWIEDYALFRALHDQRHKSWRDWEPSLRDREPAALARVRAELADEIDALVYTQWRADAQWKAARRDAQASGVKVLGDLPFMVAEDSADVWALQHLFRFDATVGVPPDAYSADGQDWGLPVPRWDEMAAQGDPWLAPRARRAADLYDAIRVDHVVGLYRTYARPRPVAGHPKGEPFFVPSAEPAQRAQGERILALLGSGAEVLAEDLGVVPDFVRASLAEQQIPGTKVLRWEEDGPIVRDPRQFAQASLAVTGTHDTEALAVWWEALTPEQRRAQAAHPPLRALAEERSYTPQVRAALLELLYGAASDSVLTPITDALGWRDRLNTPGTVGVHNWTWRLPWTLSELSRVPEVLAVLRDLAHLADRHGRRP